MQTVVIILFLIILIAVCAMYQVLRTAEELEKETAKLHEKMLRWTEEGNGTTTGPEEDPEGEPGDPGRAEG